MMINLIFYLAISILLLISHQNAFKWPIPYERVTQRPPNDPYCQAGLVPFCPTGKTIDSLPVMDASDIVEVYALKKPVWSFKYGPLLGYFHVMHDAIGIRNTRTGLNYTMEWYELDQLFNCTFPHLIANESLIWCNQGALCVYDGINDTMWKEYGVLEKVTQISGQLFNNFANWTLYDNNTAIFYETWTVYNSDNNTNNSIIMYFDSFDCASWVLRAFDQLYLLGAKFDSSVSLNYTRLNLYGKEPILLGNKSVIFSNTTLKNNIISFYEEFQKRTDYLEQAVEIFNQLFIKKIFYFYFNSVYWFIELKAPYIKITYDQVPLPGTLQLQKYL